jgi:hypothetical protein
MTTARRGSFAILSAIIALAASVLVFATITDSLAQEKQQHKLFLGMHL